MNKPPKLGLLDMLNFKRATIYCIMYKFTMLLKDTRKAFGDFKNKQKSVQSTIHWDKHQSWKSLLPTKQTVEIINGLFFSFVISNSSQFCCQFMIFTWAEAQVLSLLIFPFRFRFVFIKVYIFVQQKAWVLRP